MRDSRLDILRIILILGVICIHTFCVLDYNVYPQYRTPGLVLNTFCHYAIPLFVMLSGIVMMNRQIDSLGDFYRRRMPRILIPVVPCAIFFVLLRVLRDGDSVSVVLKELILGRPYYHLWFAFMIIGVYTIMPFLIRLYKEIDNRVLLFACGLLIYISQTGEGPYQIVPYAAYALVGMIIYRRYGVRLRRLEGGGAAIFFILVTIANSQAVLQTSSYGTIGYCSPYILLGSIAALIAWLALPNVNCAWAVRGSALVFGVYLWHPMIKGGVLAVIDRFPFLACRMWVVFPLTAICAFLSVWAISRIRIGALLLGVKEASK